VRPGETLHLLCPSQHASLIPRHSQRTRHARGREAAARALLDAIEGGREARVRMEHFRAPLGGRARRLAALPGKLGLLGKYRSKDPFVSNVSGMLLIMTAVAGGACQEHFERPGVAGRSGWKFKGDWDVEVNADHEHI
jgi:hypothetical protein